MVNLDLRRVLALPWAYRTFIRLIGSEEKRARYYREFLGARPGDRVLDIGCGPADVLSYLPPVEYYGFDMNPSYIDSARERYGDRGSFYCRRVSRDAIDDVGGQFDLVLATSVLHHLDDDEARALFDLAYNALRPGGRLISCDGCYVPGQNPLARLIISTDRGRHVRDEANYVRLARQVFENVTATIREDLSRIPYTYILLECRR
jgi:SAM-dependent methyltransferase